MKKSLTRVAGYFGCFFLGAVFTVTVIPALTSAKEFLFGFEIQCLASFPYYHRASLDSRPGMSDQTLTLEVDGRNVWISDDTAPGDLQEKLLWDQTGHILTLQLSGNGRDLRRLKPENKTRGILK